MLGAKTREDDNGRSNGIIKRIDSKSGIEPKQKPFEQICDAIEECELGARWLDQAQPPRDGSTMLWLPDKPYNFVGASKGPAGLHHFGGIGASGGYTSIQGDANDGPSSAALGRFAAFEGRPPQMQDHDAVWPVILPPMLALSDSQLTAVMTTAGKLPVEKRGLFLERVVARLSLSPGFTTAEFDEAVRLALRGLIQEKSAA